MHSLLNRYLSREKKPGIISLVVLRSQLDQVVPRLRPGGMKKLRDGFKTQGAILLSRHFDGFTDKRKLYFSKNN